MLENEKTITKRTAKDYEEFIEKANKEILTHKSRVGIK
jgi:hypothetical protein